MDADSSYGGSDTAQDSHSAGNDNHHQDGEVTTSVHQVPIDPSEHNNFYHKNEITLPVNYDEADYQSDKPRKEPHYLSTANLSINGEPHSNLEEMSNFKSTNFLNQESPKSRKRAGIDNPAFQEEELRTNGTVKSTFDSSKPYNGELNSTSTPHDPPMVEAVNLELINLKPTGKDVAGPYDNGINGIPVKKEQDGLDSGGNPYDEYFVPVNEHRKYMSKTRKGRGSVTFAEAGAACAVEADPDDGVVEYPRWMTNSRGEKLYVTMDKRSNKKGRNKCLCWGLCLCLVAAAVIIGILAAVGVIGNQGPMAKEVSARKFDGSEPQVKGGSLFGASDVETTQRPLEHISHTPGPPVSTVPSILPSTETSKIEVPRALESQLTIDNWDLSPELLDKNSTEFQALAKSLEDEIKSTLFTREMLYRGPADIEVKVMDFTRGSVIVKYRIGWKFKEGIHGAKDPLTKKSLESKMTTALRLSNGLMGVYHIKENSVSAEKILDLCQIQNNDCEHLCNFDYNVLNFYCSCPDGKMLAENQKNCEDIGFVHSNEVPIQRQFDHGYSEPKVETEPSAEPEPTAEPEPSAEPTPNVEHDHNSEPEPNTSAGFVPIAQPEPTPEPEPEPTAEPEPKSQFEHSQFPKTSPEPAQDTSTDVEHVHSEIEPESTAEPSPEYNAEEELLQGVHQEPEPKTSPEPTHIHVNEPNVVTTSEEPKTAYIATTEALEQTTLLPEQSKSELIPITSVPLSEENPTEHIVNLNTTPDTETGTEHNMETNPSIEIKETLKEETPGTSDEIKVDMSTESVETITTRHENKEPTHSDYTSFHYTNEVSQEQISTSKTSTEHETTPTTESVYAISVIVTQAPQETTTVALENETETSTKSDQLDVDPLRSQTTLRPDESEGRNFVFDDTLSNTSYEHTQTTTARPLSISTEKLPEENTIFSKGPALLNTTERSEIETETVKITTTISSNVQSDTTIIPSEENSALFNEINVISPTEQTISNSNELSQSNATTMETIIETTMHLHDDQPSTIAPGPESSTKMELLSEKNLNEMGLLNIVTPEAEVVTSSPNPIEITTIKSENENTITTSKNHLVQESFIPVVVNSNNNSIEVDDFKNAKSKFINASEIATTKPEIRDALPVVVNNEQLAVNEEERITFDLTTRTPNKENVHIINDIMFNQTSQEVQTEQTSPEYPSPFLPIIENDTLVNTLHFDEHSIYHPFILNESENHDSKNETDKSPSLENDQLNHTNPADPPPITDAVGLAVDPLGNRDNEIKMQNEVTTEASTTESHTLTPMSGYEIIFSSTENANISNNLLKNESNEYKEHTDVNTTTERIEITTINKVSIEDITNKSDIKNDTFSNIQNVTDVTPAAVATTTVKSEEVTLPPEIINNIHSNNYFENISNPKQSTEKIQQSNISDVSNTTEENNNVNNFKDFGSSTEDLIALETTTQKKTDFATTIKNTNLNEFSNIPTIHAEVEDTVTEVVKVKKDEYTTAPNALNISSSNIDSLTNTTAKPGEPLIPTTNGSSREDNTISSSDLDVTTVLPNKYEVRETISDVTTTEKLFLSVNLKNDTEKGPNNEELSVAPLSKSEETNNLDSDSNDISSYEEKSVLDKFQKNNKISEKKEAIRSDKYEKLDGKDLFVRNPYLEEKSIEKDLGTTTEITTTTHISLVVTTLNDIKPVTENYALPTFSRCNSDQFQCTNGTSVKNGSYCIPGGNRCDSVLDCSDGSDEHNCVEEGCPNNFKCTNGQCLKRHLVCDGIFNCNDNSDETECEKWMCNADELSCGNGKKCIPLAWKCDGKSQCPNSSDEHNCSLTQCSEDAFHCTQQETCIPLSWRCDGTTDCTDGEDERLCECDNEMFKCQSGGGCISKDKRCDGITNCADKSDEWDCIKIMDNILQIQPEVNVSYPVCGDSLYWNFTYAKLTCETMGFPGAIDYKIVPKTKESESNVFYTLKDNVLYGMPLLSHLKKTENGSCDKWIALTCQEYTCGSNAMNIQQARIAGGERAAPTQWPSLALLRNSQRNVQCSSTIVATAWVTASYSCLTDNGKYPKFDAKGWTLYAGSTNFFGSGDNSSTQVTMVTEIVPYPQTKFANFEYTNDIVLLKLKQALVPGRNVSIICLPNEDLNPMELCVVAGWGINKPGDPKREQYLSYLPVPNIKTEECNSTKHYNGMLSSDKICAGYTESDKSPCYNDEGAPLMCFKEDSNSWELRGLLSHHENCGKSRHPAVYTSISKQLKSWIVNTIGAQALASRGTS